MTFPKNTASGTAPTTSEDSLITVLGTLKTSYLSERLGNS